MESMVYCRVFVLHLFCKFFSDDGNASRTNFVDGARCDLSKLNAYPASWTTARFKISAQFPRENKTTDATTVDQQERYFLENEVCQFVSDILRRTYKNRSRNNRHAFRRCRASSLKNVAQVWTMQSEDDEGEADMYFGDSDEIRKITLSLASGDVYTDDVVGLALYRYQPDRDSSIQYNQNTHPSDAGPADFITMRTFTSDVVYFRR
jgi:hypothetical protein